METETHKKRKGVGGGEGGEREEPSEHDIYCSKSGDLKKKNSGSVYRGTTLPTRVEVSKAGRIAACCQPFNHLADERGLPDTLNEGVGNYGVHAVDVGGNGVSEHSSGLLR